MDDRGYYQYLQLQLCKARKKITNHHIGFRVLAPQELQNALYWEKAIRNALVMAQHREQDKIAQVLTLAEREMARGQLRPSLYQPIKSILEEED